MSTSEITAYLAGVGVRNRGTSITNFLLMASHQHAIVLTEAELAARNRLGQDAWAYWVRRGHDEAHQWQD